MATYTKEFLSEASMGQQIIVSASASTGTLIHQTSSSDTIKDEVWLYASNSGSVSVELTIQYAGTDPSKEIKVTIPSKSGLTLVIPGLILTGYIMGGQLVRAFASTINVISIVGYVNRIS